MVWGYSLDPTWSLEISFGSKGIQNQKLRFFPHSSYYVIEFGQMKQKVENGSGSRHSCVLQHDFKWMYDITYDALNFVVNTVVHM